MTSFYEPPVSYAIAIALVMFGTWAVARGARMMSDGLADASALELIRGIRLAIFALVAGFFAVGVVSGRTGFITFGAIILAEELYETGVLALFVRLGERETAGAIPGAPSVRTA
jgi:ABC-type Mn2+/Zn2+ transport system permease subunit